MDVRNGTVDIKWFQGGRTNIAYNCLDRRVRTRLTRPEGATHEDSKAVFMPCMGGGWTTVAHRMSQLGAAPVSLQHARRFLELLAQQPAGLLRKRARVVQAGGGRPLPGAPGGTSCTHALVCKAGQCAGSSWRLWAAAHDDDTHMMAHDDTCLVWQACA